MEPVKKLRLPITQRQDNRRFYHLTGLIPHSKGRHGLFVEYFFMSSMLINNIKMIVKFHQPIGIKKLSDQLMPAAGFRCQKLLFKQIHLPVTHFIFRLFLFLIFLFKTLQGMPFFLFFFSCRNMIGNGFLCHSILTEKGFIVLLIILTDLFEPPVLKGFWK